ncbi:MAG: methyltransferase, FkbM family, partial [Oscillospiraceae bacterium]|nr:methyltransferase, FkbM family [Oscillospiraceae bacterium]
NFKISGKIKYLSQITTPKSEVFENLFDFQKNESFLDLGAYDGDTVLEFIKQCGGTYEKITAIEPDRKNFKKLLKTIEKHEVKNITPLNIGIWDSSDILSFKTTASRNSSLVKGQGNEISVDCIDNIVSVQNVTFIKMDVEGSEHKALLGGKHTIATQKPKLEVAAYHRNEDLFDLILLLHEINPNYKIYLRHHPYIPAWETNIYAV